MNEIEMSPLASRNLFVLKPSEHSQSNLLHFDIFDPAISDRIMECREEQPGWFGTLLRAFEWKSITSFDVTIRATDNKPVLRVKSCGLRLCPRVKIYDEQDSLIGEFQQRSFSWKNSFRVLDSDGEPVCSILGNWNNRTFEVIADGNSLAHFGQKWAGVTQDFVNMLVKGHLGVSLADDTYFIAINENVPADSSILRKLILGAVICIEMRK